MSHTHRLLFSPSLPGHTFTRVARPIMRLLRAVAADLRRRQAVHALMESEDRMLADIGIIRGDIEAAVLRGRR